MENRGKNNRKAITSRSGGKTVPARKSNNVVSQSIGMKNVIPTASKGKPVRPAAKRKDNSVVGLKRNGRSQLRAVRNPNIITVRKKEKTPFPIAIVFSSIILTALLLFLMMNYAEINKYNSENAELTTKITDMKGELNKLSVKLDKKIDLTEIERKATQDFGMVKIESLEHHRVTLPSVDRSEIIRHDDGSEGGFGFLLNGVGEGLKDFLENE